MLLRCGSGIIINTMAKWFLEEYKNQTLFLGIDVNFDAANLTKRISDHYKVKSGC